ncbi:epimerase [Compostibacter hankyongensis]|uniref:Epimerase n=1 Tax=Compostibacter hankyongensis TaxID=1007089 RepID=A0ABP8G858_9BACT
MAYKVIITGTTGMVGEGVMMACLADPRIAGVLSVSRKPTGRSHPKLKEYLVSDFLNLKKGDENLQGYDGCFFCTGVSSIGMKEAEYSRLTYDLTTHFAGVLPQRDMAFIYVSGSGTDSSEKGRLMWARVKGKTENALLKMSFKKVYCFRPGLMKPTPGQRNVLKLYRYAGWMYPILKAVFPNSAGTLRQVGQAMIHCLINGGDKQIMEVKDINHAGGSAAEGR